jgi:DNA-binding NarL/FixJ family response regulator
MIDELPLYIQGMKVELGKIMPDSHITDANNLGDAVDILSDSRVSLVLLDGEMECVEFIQFLAQRYPHIPVVVMLRKTTEKLFGYYIRHNVKGILTREQSVEKISLVLRMVHEGIACFPEQTVVALAEKNDSTLYQLSHR